jgi:hypothetical protein
MHNRIVVEVCDPCKHCMLLRGESVFMMVRSHVIVYTNVIVRTRSAESNSCDTGLQ